MRRFILPVCAAFALAACSQTSTERQSNSNGNRNASAPTHSTTSADGATANHTNNANTVNPDMTNTNQNPAASTAPQGRITIEEARELVAQNKAVIVDVRGDSAYNDSHIKGSISIPGGDIGARAKELPKDKKIIAYCS